MRANGTGTYVRIIRDVDAARMARFPVNCTPKVDYMERKAAKETLTELNMYNA
jgi:hypothetical protein